VDTSGKSSLTDKVEGMKYMDKLDVISVQEMHAQLAAN
jgi:hypothetical protein